MILTHEQADFDALASAYGAWLLDESAQAILPARLNRNVKRFINLYVSELPFVEYRDLSAAPIDQVTLVDTQSMATLKGFTKHTRVQVIDHHALRPDLPAQWQALIEKTGAITTFFVEHLQDHLHTLNSIQATLLLLGIYEDTGSLTYASTTPRDIRAAAALVEAGASLRIAAEFLNPALSEGQKKLYDEMLPGVETVNIHGKVILIATADASEMNEEISSIAHKLRDLLDPDGLFLLVKTNEGIRIVARSTSDQVNVAKAMNPFGGGGHERAASALIDTRSPLYPGGSDPLDSLKQTLLSALEEIVQPSITVGKIMSKKPLLLSPETSLDEAARLMQRYGYEGFPVLENGQVVGLLTRRAVDRALAHHLNLNTASLMEAGNYSLSAHDTIDHLQALMAATGWGQIPVLDPQGQKVIGIVTRTDLLKTLVRENSFVPGRLNYAELLNKTLPAPRLALLKTVAEEASQEHLPIYIVGGFVRDLLLNLPSTDFDIVVEGEAIQLAKRLSDRFGGKVVSHSRFGTAKWQFKEVKTQFLAALGLAASAAPDLPDSLDLISARTEFYDHPTALPTVERSSIKLDLHRRDFTINTMALRLDGRHFGELYDYWDGLTDLRKKQVKVLHSLSFVDDPTRLLRAVRFEQRFHFHIESRTLQLMAEARPLVKQVSGDRLRHEIDLVFKEENPIAIFERLQELELLSSIHPALRWDPALASVLLAALHDPIDAAWQLPDWLGHTSLRFALASLVLLIPLGQPAAMEIANRLHLNTSFTEAIQKAVPIWQERDTLESLSASQFYRQVNGFPAIAGYALSLLTKKSIFKEKLAQYFTRWRFITPATDGNRLKEMGLQPGPQYSEIIERLRAAWIEGEVTSNAEEERLLQQLLD